MRPDYAAICDSIASACSRTPRTAASSRCWRIAVFAQDALYKHPQPGAARQGEKLGIVAAVFDTEEPIIPAGALVRIAIYLGDLLLPVLTRAEALRIRKVQ